MEPLPPEQDSLPLVLRKSTFIETIKPDTGRAIDCFQIAECARKVTAGGKPYLSFKLRDRTGECDAKLWEDRDGMNLQVGGFVKIEYEPITYRDALQLKIHKIRLLTRAEVAIEDFIPASKRDRDEMLFELANVIGTISNPQLWATLTRLIVDHGAMLRDAPAAKSKHQAYLGGLLEHILSLCGLAQYACVHYLELNRDVMIAACIVHDIGKLWELVYQDHIDYSREGSLLGHVIQGSILWENISRDVEPTLREHIAHVIVSHHGRKEWGSPQVPMTREAQVFHLLDMIDSRMETMGNILHAGVNAQGMTPYNRSTECQLWDGQEPRNDATQENCETKS